MSLIASWMSLGIAGLFLGQAIYLAGHPLTKHDAPIGVAAIAICCAVIAGVLRMP